MAHGLALAVDIGGTKTALMLADAKSHAPLALDKAETPLGLDPAAFALTLQQRADALLARERLTQHPLVAVGAAVPGTVDGDGRVARAGKLGWQSADFRRLLERTFAVPAFVEHDANAAAIGERWKGHAARVDDFVFIALGTGVGAGIFLSGRLHRGAHSAAGEIGNMLLRRRTSAQTPQAHNLDKQVGSAAIKQRAGAPRDAPAREVLAESSVIAERVADEVAAAIINVCSVIDPELVVLGGGTSNEALLERVRVRVTEELPYQPKLLTSALGEEAQLYGALYGALTGRSGSPAGP